MFDRQAAVEAAIADITKNFGPGAVMRMSGEPEPIEVIPAHSLSLGHALGIWGYPRGRSVEIAGPESSGKTTLALLAAAAAQATGGTVLYIDAEHAIDPAYAIALGVRVQDLILCQPSTFEEGMEIALALVNSGGLALVVIDSVAAMIPRAELEGDVGDATVGLLARLMSQTMRKITGPLAEHGTCAIFVNQLRDAINTMGFGPRETTPGGRALKFYASIRLDVRRIATVKDGDEATGNRTRVKVVKNKCAPPLRVAEFEIVYGEGISREGELVDLGVQYKIIDKAASWFKYNGEQLGQGRAKVIALLKDNPELAAAIEAKIKAAL